MLKFIRRKILEGIIKDFINDLPKYKVSARLLMKEKGAEILEKIEMALLEKIKAIFDKELG